MIKRTFEVRNVALHPPFCTCSLLHAICPCSVLMLAEAGMCVDLGEKEALGFEVHHEYHVRIRPCFSDPQKKYNGLPEMYIQVHYARRTTYRVCIKNDSCAKYHQVTMPFCS